MIPTLAAFALAREKCFRPRTSHFLRRYNVIPLALLTEAFQAQVQNGGMPLKSLTPFHIVKVIFDIAEDAYTEEEGELAAAIARN